MGELDEYEGNEKGMMRKERGWIEFKKWIDKSERLNIALVMRGDEEL